MTQLVLSIFPGIGILDRGFEEEGFCVVRGPDLLWGGDIRRFHPPAGVFQGVIGGPPCQTFSSLANLVRARGYEPRFGNLIPEFERCVLEAQPEWFLMENVPSAPAAKVAGYGIHSFLFDNVWLGEEQRRRRRFSFGARGAKPVDLRRWIEQAALELPIRSRTATRFQVDNSPEAKGRKQAATVTIRKGVQSKPVVSKQGGNGSNAPPGREVCAVRYSLADACRLQGLPENFLEHAPFTAQGKLQAVANGVPIPMARELARAVKRALGPAAADSARK